MTRDYYTSVNKKVVHVRGKRSKTAKINRIVFFRSSPMQIVKMYIIGVEYNLHHRVKKNELEEKKTRREKTNSQRIPAIFT